MKNAYFLMLFVALFFSGCQENKNKESDEENIKIDNDAKEIDDKDVPDDENNENDTPDADSDDEKNCYKYYNTAIASNDAGDIYIAGQKLNLLDRSYNYLGFVKQFKDNTWKDMFSCGPYDCAESKQGIWMGNNRELVVAGFSCPLFFDNDNWIEMCVKDLNAALYDVWGTSLTNVFIAGDGVILEYNGSAWTNMEIPSDEILHGVWGTASDNVYAVGKNGTVIHYNGVEWKLMESGTDKSLNSIWGMDKNNIYACGENVIVNFNGTEWKQVLKDDDSVLLGIDGTGSDNIFTVGRTTDIENPEAVIYHFDGSTWKKMETEIKNTLFDVLAMEDGSFFVVGVDTIERITL